MIGAARIRKQFTRGLAIVAIGTLLALALWPFACRLPNFVIPDDGYFYARIALNLATLSRSTFDGVHTTSGYHLPWAFVLAAVSRVVSAFTLRPDVHLLAFLALSVSIILATVRVFFDSWLFRACAFIVLLTMFSLTEMVIAAPILLALLREAVSSRPKESRTWELWLAPALALVRVDLSCVPLIVALLLWRADRRRGLMLAGATLLGVGLQLLTMKLTFGHFISVAPLIKMGGTLPGVPWHLTYNLRAARLQTVLYGAHVVIAVLTLLLRRDGSTRLLVLAALSFIVVHSSFSILRVWYWVPCSLGLLFALQHATRARESSRVRSLSAGAAVATLALALVVYSVRLELFYAVDQKNASAFLAELRTRVPPATRIFTFDNPGFFGFFSGLRVIDGDGLVNDYDYARRFHANQLHGYLDEESICYVFVDYADARPILDLAGIVLEDSDVVRLTEIRRYRPRQSDFVLYRLRAPRCS